MDKLLKLTFAENLKDYDYFQARLTAELKKLNNADGVKEAITDCNDILENIKVSYKTHFCSSSNSIEKIEP